MKEHMSKITTRLFYELAAIIATIYAGFGAYFVASDAINRLNEWRPGLLQLINWQHEVSIVCGTIVAIKIYGIMTRKLDEEVNKYFC